MLGLLYKEFIACKRAIIFPFLMYLLLFWSTVILYLCLSVEASETFLHDMLPVSTIAILFMILNSMQGEMFKKDERRIWANYAVSLPTSVVGQVKVKYYYFFIINSIALFVTQCNEWIIKAVYKESSGLGGSIAFMFFMLYLVIFAIDMPFIFRFGRAFGGYVKTILMLALIFIVMLYALFGDISMFLGEDEIEVAIFKFLEMVFSNESVAISMGLGCWAVLGLYFLYYKISCKLYLKGVDMYDQ